MSEETNEEIEKLQKKFGCPLIFISDLGEKTGAPIAIDDSVMLPKDTNAWFTSAEVELGEIELVAGDNTIEFITVGTDGCNFDYIKLVPVTE